jgi:hypothetical protein
MASALVRARVNQASALAFVRSVVTSIMAIVAAWRMVCAFIFPSSPVVPRVRVALVPATKASAVVVAKRMMSAARLSSGAEPS